MNVLLFNLVTDCDDPVLGFTTLWIQELAKHCDTIDVITMRAGRIQAPENVRVFSVGKEHGYSEPRRAIEFYRILLRLLRTKKYDVCFAHMMPLFIVLGAPVLRLKHIQIVLWYTHKSVTVILRLAHALTDRVVTASPESFRIPSNKVRIIGHGIPTRLFVPSENDARGKRPFTFLTVGRLSRIKRIDLLLQALWLVKQRQPDVSVQLQIVGGPVTEADLRYEAELQELVKQYELREDVHFLGSMTFRQVLPYYQQADCFVNLSETGSIDKAVLEAMSCGKAVLVNPVFTALLGPDLAQRCVVNWEIEQLYERLIGMMRLPADERQALGAQLRQLVVRDHDLRGLCKRLVQEFQDVIAKKR